MERKQISDETLLAVMDMSIRRTAESMKKNGRGAFVTTSEAIGAMVEKMWEVTKANDDNDPYKIANAFLDVATVCFFAVGSMAATPETSVAPVEGVKDAPVDPEIVRELAHKKMMERTTSSGLIVTSEMP